MKFETDTHIDAPPERVFEFVNTAENALEYISGLVDIDNVEDLPNGGYECDYRYKLAGIKLDGTIAVIECETHDRLDFELTGPMSGTEKYTFMPEDGGTRLASTLDVTLTGTVLDKVLEPVARKYLKRDHDSSLSMIKTIVETEVEVEVEPAAE